MTEKSMSSCSLLAQERHDCPKKNSGHLPIFADTHNSPSHGDC